MVLFVKIIFHNARDETFKLGVMCDQSGRGFNLLLLEVPGGLYGEWFVLNNTNSGFNRNPRIEPFGFTIQELPKEIVHITSTHIYNSELSKFNQTEFLEFFADRV